MSDCTTTLPSLATPHRASPYLAQPNQAAPNPTSPREHNIPAQRSRTKEDAMKTTQEDRRADMTTDRLSRRARTILAMDALMMDVENDPRRITRQDIATKAADWTTDAVSMFSEEDPADDEYEDYYQLINALMHIVHAMLHENGDA